MNVKVGCSGKIKMQIWGRGKDAEGLKVLKYAMCICIRQYNETHKALFEKWGKERGANGNIMQSVNLFNVHCIHV
jgi:hypothetical protein